MVRRFIIRVAAAAASLAAFVLPSAAKAQSGVSTESVFQNAGGTLTDLYQPLFFYEAAPQTQYVQDSEFTNGTTDTAGSEISILGTSQNADGSTSAILDFKVIAPDTQAVALTSHILCNTVAAYSQCITGITIPAGFSANDLRLTRIAEDGSTGNYWWNAAWAAGGSQTNVGLILVPGGPSTVDTKQNVVDHVLYTGSAATCAATPQSNVSFFEPFQGSSFGAYESSSAAAGTCPTAFTPISSPPTTGVNIVAPN